MFSVGWGRPGQGMGSRSPFENAGPELGAGLIRADQAWRVGIGGLLPGKLSGYMRPSRWGREEG